MTITVFRVRVALLTTLMFAFFATAMLVKGGYSHHQEWFLLMCVASVWAFFELARLFVLAVSRYKGDASFHMFFGIWSLLFASGSLLVLMFGYSFLGIVSDGYFLIFVIAIFIFGSLLLDLATNRPGRP